ncbi:MAG: hypothetical protein ACHQUC_02605 [Chlamydiales bacterium]
MFIFRYADQSEATLHQNSSFFEESTERSIAKICYQFPFQDNQQVKISWSEEKNIRVKLLSSAENPQQIFPQLPLTLSAIHTAKKFFDSLRHANLSLRKDENDQWHLEEKPNVSQGEPSLMQSSHWEEIGEVYLLMHSQNKACASTWPGKPNLPLFRNFLSAKQISETQIGGDLLTSLINAVLQHITGNYMTLTFDVTEGIKDVITVEGSSEGSMIDEALLLQLLESVKLIYEIDLRLGIVNVDEDGLPYFEREIGNESGFLVAIWKKENQYVCLVPSHFLFETHRINSTAVLSNDFPDELYGSPLSSPCVSDGDLSHLFRDDRGEEENFSRWLTGDALELDLRDGFNPY